MLPSSVQIEAMMVGAVLIVLALAAREDVLRHRVPNALNAAALVVGLGLASVAAGWSGLLQSMGGVAVGTAALLPFYLRRGMGAGDVKLMAAAGAFLGPGSALVAAAIALVAGMFLAFGAVVRRWAEVRRVDAAVPAGTDPAVGRAAAAVISVRHERFPYAVAIGIGVVTALSLDGSLGALWIALGIT